jgi:hypothetical protein
MPKLCSLLLIVTLGCSPIFAARASEFEAPEIAIEEAITLAKRHVSSEKIDVSESYIALAKWHPKSGLLSYWRIEWKTKKPAKGGRTIVTVYADGKIEHGFGE